MSADGRRLANLVLTNFDELSTLGVAHGRRSRRVVDIAQRDFDTASATLAEQPAAIAAVLPWRRLHTLTVGPFRGFMRQETFDLQRRITLVYGPNGSGKSSFCEAIELALIGSVGESDARRIQPDSFFANARLRRFDPPQMTAVDAQGNVVPVRADEEALRFCLVERNRVEDFARLAARQPAAKERMIATLFGIDAFDAWVRGFNDEIDDYVDLRGARQIELDRCRTALATDQQRVAGEAQALADLTREGQAIAGGFRAGMTYQAAADFLGTAERPGRLQRLQALLSTPIRAENGMTVAALVDGRTMARTGEAEVVRLNDELAQRQGEVSFRRLYEAVITLQADSPDHCPACDTPLHGDPHVVTDPFQKANDGLVRLQDLARLEEQHALARTRSAGASRALRNTVSRIAAFLQASLPSLAGIAAQIRQLPDDPQGTWWQTLGDGDGSDWQLLEATAEYIERDDASARTHDQVRAGWLRERQTLEALRERMLRHDIERSGIERELNAARARIALFDEDHRPLIEQAALEPPVIARNGRIKAGYDELLAALRQYRDALPGVLLADLNERTIALYNAFNRDDPPGDRIVYLSLPTRVADPIQFACEGAPELRMDALHVMSEGHIRCLGLSILLAKNLAMGSPVLVLDDIVNAIDDDHRNGIRCTLFEDGLFDHAQIIVTCHGEEFIKNIQNGLGAEAANAACTAYDFLPHLGDHHLRINNAARTRNYVLGARDDLASGRLRDSLSSGRKALEALTRRVWQWLRNRGRGEIRLKMAGPKAHPELHDLTQALAGALNETTFQHDRKAALAAPLAALLTENVGGLEWSYLNGGTHESERGEEFDRAVVTRIVNALVALDAALSP